MFSDDVTIYSEEEHVVDDKINDVVVEDNMSEDQRTIESNTEMAVVSLSQLVPKLPFPIESLCESAIEYW